MLESCEHRLTLIEERLNLLTNVSEKILREIDEGTPSRPSLRTRLHRLESKDAAVTMLADELRRRSRGWREWTVTATAVAGVVLGQHFWS